MVHSVEILLGLSLVNVIHGNALGPMQNDPVKMSSYAEHCHFLGRNQETLAGVRKVKAGVVLVDRYCGKIDRKQ